MKKLFHFFIDGLGLGDDSESNPVRKCFYSSLGGSSLIKRDRAFFIPGGKGVVVPADPVQGVAGIPQSATGQTSLFTGVNAQAYLNMHLRAFPNEKLMEIIKERNLLKVLKENGLQVTSANLYSRDFFEKREGRRKNSFAVSTLSIMTAEIPFRFFPEYRQKKAVFADITNSYIRSRGYDIPLIKPEEGAAVIRNILNDFDAVFFEYFMTDTAGHKRDSASLQKRVEDLSRFLEKLIELTRDMDELLILVSSDHGNAEDMETGDHTLNPVPVILFTEDNALQEEAAESIRQLTDVYDFVLRYFSIPGSGKT